MENEKKVVFDAGRQIEIRLQSADGAKTVKVRFPTDPYEASQIIERLRQADVDDVASEGSGFRACAYLAASRPTCCACPAPKT